MVIKRSRKLFSIFVALIILAGFPLSFPSPVQAAGSAEEGAKAIAEIMEYLAGYHLSRPDIAALTKGAIEGMVKTLNDPYTEYLSPDELSFFTSAVEGEFSGIGIELGGDPAGGGYPGVITVLPGSPAAAAGVLAGDQIVSVDGKVTSGLELAEVVQMIRGPAGSVVRLTVKRSGKVFNVEVERSQIAAPSCTWEIFPDKTGYISVQNFGSRTAREFEVALEGLVKAGIKGLVLDLRNDPGGYLQAAVDIAGCFLPPGVPVVTTVDRDGQREVLKTPANSPAWKLPLVILVNQSTASAAEVLAGALEDYGVASLVGTRSFGKGVVQAVVPLSSGGALKLTVASFLTPRGRSLEKKGLLPQRVVSLPELQPFVARQLIGSRKTGEVTFCLGESGAWVDGEKISTRLTPFLSDGMIYLPVRFILEVFGWEVDWGEKTGEITARKGNNAVLLAGGNGLVTKNGTAYASKNFLENLHFRVRWDENKITVGIDSPAAEEE
jgi:carboxyl-terminal processing protease